MKPHFQPFLVRLDDDGFVDEVHLRVVPRFKSSELSGEWRHSFEAVAYRKGRELGSWARLEWALMRLGPWLQDELSPIENPALTEDLCMQPGCAMPYTVEYRLMSRGCGSHDRYTDDYRFCDDHARDSDLDDMDSIYQRIEA